jgi:hypothetical protein
VTDDEPTNAAYYAWVRQAARVYVEIRCGGPDGRGRKCRKVFAAVFENILDDGGLAWDLRMTPGCHHNLWPEDIDGDELRALIEQANRRGPDAKPLTYLLTPRADPHPPIVETVVRVSVDRE